jgi:anti-sigma-K factor RskA
MMQRVLTLSLAAMFVLAVSVVVAADKEKSDSKVVGTVSVAGDGKITVTDKDGKDHAMTVAKDAKISCDGKECKLEDLKKGTAVTIGLNPDHKDVASSIEAKTAKDKDK